MVRLSVPGMARFTGNRTVRVMGTYHGKGRITDSSLLGDVDSVDQRPGAGVPVGTPRAEWDSYGYETRCASVVKVSDFLPRRPKALSLPIVLGSTYELDDTAHGARLHDKKEAAYADGDGYVYARWGSPTNEGAARQLAALEGIGPEHEGGCMLFSSGMAGALATHGRENPDSVPLSLSGSLCLTGLLVWTAAITGALQAALRSGDHAVFPYTVYGGTHEFLVEFAQHWGIEYTLVDPTRPNEYGAAMKSNTKVR